MKKSLAVVLVSIWGLSCMQSKKLKRLEEDLETSQLINYQLLDKVNKLERRLSSLQSKPMVVNQTVTAVDTTPPAEVDKRNLYIMQMKLMNYQLVNEKYPETVQELKSVLGTIPTEVRSNTNVVHLARNGAGGWVYDPDEGTLDINTWNKR